MHFYLYGAQIEAQIDDRELREKKHGTQIRVQIEAQNPGKSYQVSINGGGFVTLVVYMKTWTLHVVIIFDDEHKNK